MVDQVIASYFAEIYKRPDHMQAHLAQEVGENADMEEETINTTALFTIDEIREATKQSNFNIGLGPDCFDGNLVSQNRMSNFGQRYCRR
jgi:hypothetical protein